MRKVLITLLLIALWVGTYKAYPLLTERISERVKATPVISVLPEDDIETETQEFVTEPLHHFVQGTPGKLTPAMVISYTNNERRANGKKALTFNAELAAAAESKIQDMFDNQYFEHESPDGQGAAEIIEKAGYAYIIVGENLAMGNFKDDQALIEAWMASPGHKANMLNNRFTEIGVAVGKGTFNGKTTWLAVQEFGLPASTCQSVNAGFKAQIDEDTEKVDDMSLTLVGLQKELRTQPRNTDAEEAVYRTKVEQYNTLVTQYNKLAVQLKIDVEEYNSSVRLYNKCIEQ
ncbi:MAG: CAP domain-containing protein [bacterium]|nr:CAP domain-containing protein [bacterium]